jgi:hypothetical protein
VLTKQKCAFETVGRVLDSSCSTLPELVHRWNERLVQREVSQRLVQGKPACLVPDRHRLGKNAAEDDVGDFALTVDNI